MTLRFPRLPDVLVAILSFFLANMPAMITVLWLIPGLVYMEAVAWMMLAIAVGWLGVRGGLLPSLRLAFGKSWIILPFAALAGTSIIWSDYWQISLARWITLLCTVAVGAYLGLRLDLSRFIRLLSIFGVLVLLVAAIVVVLAPSQGIMNYYIIQGAWKGLYWHKNHMGLIAALFCVVFLFEAFRDRPSRWKSEWFWALCYLSALLFTYESGSVAAYAVLIGLHVGLVLFLGFLRIRSRLRILHYASFALIAVLAVALLLANSDRVFGLFNRNSTLTGRIPMWGHLFDVYLSRRPLIGYGFNAFWYIDVHRTTMQQLAGYPDPIVISDNGFIDILMNTGYVGLALFLVFYLGLWFISAKYAWTSSSLLGLFPLTVMAYTLLANVSWSLLFENEGFLLLIMIGLMFRLSSGAPEPLGPNAVAEAGFRPA